jgi:hypothetical protein
MRDALLGLGLGYGAGYTMAGIVNLNRAQVFEARQAAVDTFVAGAIMFAIATVVMVVLAQLDVNRGRRGYERD